MYTLGMIRKVADAMAPNPEAVIEPTIEVERLARALHSAPLSVPCIGWRGPFEKCLLRDSHTEKAEVIIAEYDRLLAADYGEPT